MGENKKSLIQIINETPLGRRIVKFTAAGFFFSGILLGADSYITKRKTKNIDNIVYAAEIASGSSMHAVTPEDVEAMKNRIIPEAEKKFFEVEKIYVKDCISSNPAKSIIKSTVDPIGETFDIIKQEYCQNYPEEYAALKGKIGFLETATKLYSSTNIPLTALKESIRYGKNMIKELMQKKADDLKLKALDKELDFVSQRIESIDAGIPQPNICRVILPFKTPETLDEVLAYRKFGVVDYMKAIRAKQGVLVVDSISKLTEQVNPEEWLKLYERVTAQAGLSPYFPPEDLNPCRMLQEGYEGTKVAVMKRFYQMDEYGRLIPIGDTLDEIVKKAEPQPTEKPKPVETARIPEPAKPNLEERTAQQQEDTCDYYPLWVGMEIANTDSSIFRVIGKEYYNGKECFVITRSDSIKDYVYKDRGRLDLYKRVIGGFWSDTTVVYNPPWRLLDSSLESGRKWSSETNANGTRLYRASEVVERKTVYFKGKPHNAFVVRTVVLGEGTRNTEFSTYACNIGLINFKSTGTCGTQSMSLENIR